MQAPASVAWPARPVLALPASKHAWRLPSPGHQPSAAQFASTPLHDDALIDTLKDALVETWNAIGIPFASQQPAQAERSTKVTPLVVSQAGG